MSDQLLSAVNSDEPPALIPIAPTITEGLNALSDGDYQSDTDAEQPVLLELGVSSTSNSSVDYPLNMHMNGNATYNPPVTSVFDPYHSVSTATLPMAQLGLYGSPYSQHTLAGTSNINVTALHTSVPPPPPPPPPPTTSLMHTGASAYSIPQTVCSWPTVSGAGVMDATRSEAKNRIVSMELVQPSMRLVYNTAAYELNVVKELNPSWKEKALQIEKDYKKTACDRERTRMRDMNRAFDLLRSKLPISKPNGKKYSKIESLRIAINYINHLQQTLNDSQAPPVDHMTLRSSSKSRQAQNGVDYVLGLDSNRRLQTFDYEPTPHEERTTTENSAWANDNDTNYDTGKEQWE